MVNHDSFVSNYYKHVTFLVGSFDLVFIKTKT